MNEFLSQSLFNLIYRKLLKVIGSSMRIWLTYRIRNIRNVFSKVVITNYNIHMSGGCLGNMN